jgi:hypothetical protein
MKLLHEISMRLTTPWKGDEDERPPGLPEKLDFGECRMFARFFAEPIIRVQKNEVRALQCCAHLFSPRGPPVARWHRLPMKNCPFRPDVCLLQRGDATLMQRGEPSMKFGIKAPPFRFVTPFQMPPILPSIVTWIVVPSEPQHPVGARQRPQ